MLLVNQFTVLYNVQLYSHILLLHIYFIAITNYPFSYIQSYSILYNYILTKYILFYSCLNTYFCPFSLIPSNYQLHCSCFLISQKFQDEAVSLYRKCALIPSITDASISVKDKTLSIYSTWSQRNLELNNKRTFSRRFHYSLNGDGCPEDGKRFEDNFPRQMGDE